MARLGVVVRLGLVTLILAGALTAASSATPAAAQVAPVCSPATPAACLPAVSKLLTLWGLSGTDFRPWGQDSISEAARNGTCDQLETEHDQDVCEIMRDKAGSVDLGAWVVGAARDAYLEQQEAAWNTGPGRFLEGVPDNWAETADAVIATTSVAPDFDFYVDGASQFGQQLPMAGDFPEGAYGGQLLGQFYNKSYEGRAANKVILMASFRLDPAVTLGTEVEVWHGWASNTTGDSGGIGNQRITWAREHIGGDPEVPDVRVRWRAGASQVQSVYLLDHPVTDSVAVAWGNQGSNYYNLAVGNGTGESLRNQQTGYHSWNQLTFEGVAEPFVVSNGFERLWIWWGTYPESWDFLREQLMELRTRQARPFSDGTAEVPAGPAPSIVETEVVTPEEVPAPEITTTTTFAPTVTIAPAPEESPEQEAARELGNRQAGFFDNLASKIGSGFGWLGNTMKGLFQWLIDVLTSLFGALSELLKRLFEALQQAMIEGFSIISGWLSALLQALQMLLGEVINLLVHLPEALFELLKIPFATVIEILQWIWTGILNLPSLIWEQFIDGLTDITGWLGDWFVPQEFAWELENCSTSMPCSWISEGIETVGLVYDGLEGSLVECVAPGIGWDQFLVSLPPPSGCAAAAGAVTVESGAVAAGGDLFGYRVVVRTVLAIAMFLAVAAQITGWAPWQKKDDAPQQLTLPGFEV